MDLKEIAKEYFKVFSRKDLNALGSMFHESVSLRDWGISADGKIEVLSANERIFGSVTTIEVTPTSIYQDGDVIIAEVDIVADGHPPIWVVDLLTFDKEGKILGIRAYKG